MPFDIYMVFVVSIALNVVLAIALMVKCISGNKLTGELDILDLPNTSGKPPINLTFHFDPFGTNEGDKATFTIHRG
jgi:hypothetical protein